MDAGTTAAAAKKHVVIVGAGFRRTKLLSTASLGQTRVPDHPD
jgi:hypothetical protein